MLDVKVRVSCPSSGPGTSQADMARAKAVQGQAGSTFNLLTDSQPSDREGGKPTTLDF